MSPSCLIEHNSPDYLPHFGFNVGVTGSNKSTCMESFVLASTTDNEMMLNWFSEVLKIGKCSHLIPYCWLY